MVHKASFIAFILHVSGIHHNSHGKLFVQIFWSYNRVKSHSHITHLMNIPYSITFCVYFHFDIVLIFAE